jgi:hypothetical protein
MGTMAGNTLVPWLHGGEYLLLEIVDIHQSTKV